ncbi:hypothetical protein G9A89_014515 [Geosiphon pyriformis]|nr:hypothetical protein G9A89_014515 [Geosiphon pyriformis]
MGKERYFFDYSMLSLWSRDQQKKEFSSATVGYNIAIIKKSIKSFVANTISENIASRKKRKRGVLKDSIAYEVVLCKKVVGSSWGSKAGNTTKSDSVNIKEECIIEKTSIDYGERNVFNKTDFNQTPKGLRLVTKKALDILLRKINFLDDVDNNDIFLDVFVVLFSLLKNLVNVSVRKLFALDIGLDKVVKKSS